MTFAHVVFAIEIKWAFSVYGVTIDIIVLL